jgi:hypothetical protein
VFTVLTGLSLWAGYGNTTVQLAERIANKAMAGTAQQDNRGTLNRLRDQRDALSFTETSAAAVEAVQAAVTAATEQAASERARGDCKELWAGNGRGRSALPAKPYARPRRTGR